MKKDEIYASPQAGAQGFAQVAQGLLRSLPLILAGLAFLRCAPPIRETQKASTNADAVLPTGQYLFIFDFANTRYQKWPLPEEGSGTSCRLIDTLRGKWWAPAHWLALASPAQPFQPMRAIWGPNGNFFLLDRAAKRLVLYDTNAQFLSGFPLPQEIRERSLERLEVYWTKDGLFSFLDLGEGKVWKYAELRSTAGSGDWQLRYSSNLPLGLEACVWEPFLRNPQCLGRNGRITAFDNYFNAAGPGTVPAGSGGIRMEAAPGDASWRMVLEGGHDCAVPARYYYSPENGGFAPASDTTAPTTGPNPP